MISDRNPPLHFTLPTTLTIRVIAMRRYMRFLYFSINWAGNQKRTHRVIILDKSLDTTSCTAELGNNFICGTCTVFTVYLVTFFRGGIISLCSRGNFLRCRQLAAADHSIIRGTRGPRFIGCILYVVVVDSHIQRIVLATEETTVTQQISHRPIKCQ